MKPNLRRERTLFLLFLGASFVALMAALPMVTAQQTQMAPKGEEMQKPSAAAGSSAPASPAPSTSVPAPSTSETPSFEQADRNKDGFLDKSESGVVPGLSANFERADRNRDGKLDREEFAKGLQILQVRR
jgi:EF hand